ncbi:class I SAM-dependent methyltransferase [Nitratireductor pacificus]|nr:class I SAM-dependent methyltransferase [Nitratireductor pacificus]
MNAMSDARFWDRTSRRYARSAIADRAGYERTLERAAALLGADHRVLELGCGTGTTALRLAGGVQSYLATDISPGMIGIAEERRAEAGAAPALSFRAATAEEIAAEAGRFDVVLGFNYLHLVRDLPGTLRSVQALLAEDGIFISKTPCLGDMNPLLRWVLLPAMRALGLAPHVTSFRLEELEAQMEAARLEIRAVEWHATKGGDDRPFIVARRVSR